MLVPVPPSKKKATKHLESASWELNFLLGIMEGNTKKRICVTVCVVLMRRGTCMASFKLLLLQPSTVAK